jgi:hypothetical protein
VLLRAHAASLKLLPTRLEKALAAETGKLGDLVIAHQNAIGRMASLMDQSGRKDQVVPPGKSLTSFESYEDSFFRMSIGVLGYN